MKRLTMLMLVAFAAAIAQPNCSMDISMDMLQGTYAVSYYGTMQIMQPGAASPMTATGGIVGVISIGYDGAISGGAAVSGFGPVTDYEVAGTAQLTGCVGKLSLKVRPKGVTEWKTEIDRFVLDPDGKTLLVIIVDFGPGVYPAIQGTWKRISHLPYAASW
jgi:hypothetical protein